MENIILCDMRNGWRLVKCSIYSNPKPHQIKTEWRFDARRDIDEEVGK